MKRLFSFFACTLFLQAALFATTPYNLEGIKALNILVLDENDVLSEQLEKKLASALYKKLEANAIMGQKDGVGAMFVKIRALKVNKTYVIHLTLGVGEEAEVIRNTKVKSYVLTYSYDDMIETKTPDKDVYDDVMNYLIDEFLEQYDEDNDI